MFYHLNLLKKNGRFYICWIADAYPEKFSKMPPRQIRHHSIPELCDDLLQVVISESSNPHKRFSLRLSSRLILGLLRLYQKQVNLLISDIFSLNESVRKGLERLHDPPKKKTPKKPHSPEREIPAAVLEQANIANVVQNIDQITIRENTIPPTSIPYDGFGDEKDPVLQLLELPEDVLCLPEVSMLDQTRLHVHATVHADQYGRKSHAEPLHSKASMLDVTPAKHLNITDPEFGNVTPDISKVMQELNIDNIDVPEVIVHPAPTTILPQKRSFPIDEEEKLEDVVITPRPKKKKKMIFIDKQTQIKTEFMHIRINDPHVDLRCKDTKEDILRFGSLFSSRLISLSFLENENVRLSLHMMRTSKQLCTAFTRNLITRPAREKMITLRLMRDREVIRDVQPPTDKSLKNITATNFTINKTFDQTHTLPFVPEQIENPQMMVTSPITKRTRNAIQNQTTNKNRSNNGIPSTKTTSTPKPDVCLTTTMEDIQKEILIDMHMEKFEAGDQMEKVITVDQSKDMEIPPMDIPPMDIPPVDISANLEKSKALDDIEVMPEEGNGKENSLDKNSSINETGLGSLDRTRVSLGDQISSTNPIKNYLNEHWGPGPLVEKLWTARMDGVRPTTLEKIIKRSYIPTDIVSERIVAARAFMSLLHLKANGILKVKKNEDLTIAHITAGEKLKQGLRRQPSLQSE